jgi:hypothetical protein
MTCPTCNRDWRLLNENKADKGLGREWDYVCVPTGRADDAQVTKRSDEDHYSVWSRGGGYGEFETLEQAKSQGEKIVKIRKLDCEDK